MAILALVGPDHSGKSTIVEGLRQEDWWKPDKVKFYKGTHVPEEQVATTLLDVLADVDPFTLTICDRLHYPDDIIYAPIVTGRVSPLAKYGNLMRALLHYSSTLFLHVTADHTVLQARHEELGDEYINGTQLRKVKDTYDGFFNGNNCFPVESITVDTTHLGADDIFNVVQHVIVDRFPWAIE